MSKTLNVDREEKKLRRWNYISIFYDHNTVRLEINYKQKSSKNKNMWRLNNKLLNDQKVTEEIMDKI